MFLSNNTLLCIIVGTFTGLFCFQLYDLLLLEVGLKVDFNLHYVMLLYLLLCFPQ
jgi:hypothetical protein